MRKNLRDRSVTVFSHNNNILKVQICKKINLKDARGSSSIFGSAFVRNKGCKAPDLVDILEAPKTIQKVLEYVQKP